MKNIKSIIGLFFIIPLFSFGNTINVNQDGSGNFASIQSAILFASTGDTVLVHPGNYIEIIDFIGKDITVASLFLTTQDTSYISQTVIDGNQENNRLVRFTNGETEDAKLIGFTITRATDPIEPGGIYVIQGLGIYINSSSPIIANNRIINNSYEGWYYSGGGIAMKNSSAKIKNNIIGSNDKVFHGGGIYMNKCTNVVIEENYIHDNTLFSGYGISFGAGIYIDSSQYISISKNSFERNYQYHEGGAMYINNCNHIFITNNNIEDNGENSDFGGGIQTRWSENIYIVGNLITNNKAGAGAGLFFEDSQVQLVNNTICSNESESFGGGILCRNSDAIIQNNIIYSNTARTDGDQMYLNISSTSSIYFSNIEGGLEAIGLEGSSFDGIYENNLDSDPLLTNSGTHPYQIEINSPCMNTGNPDTTGLFIPEFDLVGNERISQNRIDMGAYEYYFPSDIHEQLEASKILIYPNPAHDNITIWTPQNEIEKPTFSIYDIKGSSVFKKQINTSKQMLDVSFLPKGIYIIEITNSKIVKSDKLILY